MAYLVTECVHTDTTWDVFHDSFSVETLCRERDKEAPFSVAKCRSPNITH
jgi:hypothetical protein